MALGKTEPTGFSHIYRCPRNVQAHQTILEEEHLELRLTQNVGPYVLLLYHADAPS